MTTPDYFHLDFFPPPAGRQAFTDELAAASQGFAEYVQKEVEATRLFDTIALSLYGERPQDCRVSTDISGGEGGRLVQETYGVAVPRLSNPNTPMAQNIYYPGVEIQKSRDKNTVGILSETVQYKGDLNSPAISRVPGLYIVPKKHYDAFLADELDDASDIVDYCIEGYSRGCIDMAGRVEYPQAFHEAHDVFFRSRRTDAGIREQKQRQNHERSIQSAYISRLRQIGTVVLGRGL